MVVPRNRGLYKNGQPIAPGTRMPVSREALAGDQAGEHIGTMTNAISDRVHQMFDPKPARPRLPIKDV
ncbi:hypothetical protein UFOVP629_53 [uncultured Caudovirales phage]|uniref:Uncharacterized protein n=1 Tax=uncultured Caudovirales phage TaxID=2100421 RepID=A0A6J5N7B5_9CAUD|nr:hypothetical protein UFOVP629_53 [uncultured Caudovirales phage]